jgi:GNAT superfamily N-acetyltransferase
MLRRSYPPTSLGAGSFRIGEELDVRCTRSPHVDVIEAVDHAWIPQRRPTDVDWRWRDRLDEAHDMFVLVKCRDAHPVALFCSTAPRLLRLPGGPAYRLDFLEVGPLYRGAQVGVFTLAVAAARALECGARKLVLASVAEARNLYEKTGGKQRLAEGWRVPRGLVPFEFVEDDLRVLEEALHEQQQD